MCRRAAVVLSKIFVNPSTLPSALGAFFEITPLSHVVDASRGLMYGDVVAAEVLLVFAEAGVLTAVFVPLAAHLYRSPS
jgi:ABC-2 type transport system permease protein